MLRAARDGVMLAVRVQPGAKRSAMAGVYGEGVQARLKVTVRAPAVEGLANRALLAFLAESFGVRTSAIDLVSGAKSRSKAFLLRGVSLAQAEAIVKAKLEA